MARFFPELRNLFGEDELYRILNVSILSSCSEVRKAYYECSMKFHPDYVKEPVVEFSVILKKFQALGKVYSILSDRLKCVLYNREGAVAIETGVDHMKDYRNDWNTLFGPLNFGDIDAFEKKHRGSSEELAELKAGYLQYEGDLERVVANTLCCGTDEDMIRHERTLSQLIADKELPTFVNFQDIIKRSGRNQVSGSRKRQQSAIAKTRRPSVNNTKLEDLSMEVPQAPTTSTELEHRVDQTNSKNEETSRSRKKGTKFGSKNHTSVDVETIDAVSSVSPETVYSAEVTHSSSAYNDKKPREDTAAAGSQDKSGAAAEDDNSDGTNCSANDPLLPSDRGTTAQWKDALSAMSDFNPGTMIMPAADVDAAMVVEESRLATVDKAAHPEACNGEHQPDCDGDHENNVIERKTARELADELKKAGIVESKGKKSETLSRPARIDRTKKSSWKAPVKVKGSVNKPE